MQNLVSESMAAMLRDESVYSSDGSYDYYKNLVPHFQASSLHKNNTIILSHDAFGANRHIRQHT